MNMDKKIATRQSYGEALANLGEKNENIVVLDADLSSATKTSIFAKKFPDRFIDAGISEQNMMGISAGLSTFGKIPYASTFAVFAAGRAYDQIRNSIAYPRLNVKICATHAGITVGEDGASHQTFEDIALMRTIPGMTVINPSDGVSAAELIRQAIEYDGPCYIRLGRAAVPVFYQPGDYIKLGKGNWLRRGSNATVIATGIMVSEAMAAAAALAEEGIDIGVIDIHTIKPIDEDILIEAASVGPVVTAEEHSVIGGLGGAVAEVLSRRFPVKMEMVGQQDTFGESGKPDELKSKYHMTAVDIVEAVKRVL